VRIAPTPMTMRLRMIPMALLFPDRVDGNADAPGRIRTSDPRLRRPLLFR
jgi:hypothetical protein